MSSARLSEDGYTLTEMVVALLILGLAMGGVMQATSLLAHLQNSAQTRITGFEARRRLQTAFSSVFEHAGPFRSSSAAFEGDARTLRFGCGGSDCEARLDGFGAATRLDLAAPQTSHLRLGPIDTPRFEYVGSASTGDVWPPEGRDTQRLVAVRLMAGQGRSLSPLATATIWRQEEPSCRFDAIAKDCRS